MHVPRDSLAARSSQACGDMLPAWLPASQLPAQPPHGELQGDILGDTGCPNHSATSPLLLEPLGETLAYSTGVTSLLG